MTDEVVCLCPTHHRELFVFGGDRRCPGGTRRGHPVRDRWLVYNKRTKRVMYEATAEEGIVTLDGTLAQRPTPARKRGAS